MFQETNDAVARVEVATLGGVELSPAGLDRAVESHLLAAIKGKVEPGREAAALETLKGKFDLILSAAGTATLAARDGRPVAEAIGEALARPTGPGAEAYAHWQAQMRQHEQWHQQRPDYVARGLNLPRA